MFGSSSRKAWANRAGQRESSSEISLEARPGKETGRPTRQNAGRRSLPSGFVSTTDVVKQEDLAISSDDDDDGGLGPRNKRKKSSKTPANGRSKKRKTLCPRKSPPPPRLSPVLDDDPLPRDASLSPEPTEASPGVISMTFQVPEGHKGPFVVNLDLGGLLRKPLQPSLRPEAPQKLIAPIESPKTGRSSKRVSSSKKSRKARGTPVGFLDLPAELRNIIYEHAFVTKEPLNLARPTNFGLSASFLATCSQVYNEAKPILYGRNKFEFERQAHLRATLWQNEWKEVGWKDVRRFLKMIGPTNIALMRNLYIFFEDGAPSSNPGHKSYEDLRFVHDEHLIDCLRLLAYYSQLQKIALTFHGRKAVSRNDERFLNHLRKIQADEVNLADCPGQRYWHHRYSKYDRCAGEFLESMMQRVEKLYEI